VVGQFCGLGRSRPGPCLCSFFWSFDLKVEGYWAPESVEITKLFRIGATSQNKETCSSVVAVFLLV